MFFTYMFMPYQRYFDFSGRSRRMEYWAFYLFFYVSIVILALLAVLAGAGQEKGEPLGVMSIFFLILLSALTLGSIIPGIAVTVRRFHDQGHSGWMYCLCFVPYVGGLIVTVFMFIDGTRGSNQYGPSPKFEATSYDEIFA